MQEAEKSAEHIYKLLDHVFDPEVPVLSVTDLGIIRSVIYNKENNEALITVTPTYSGCPATDVINMSIRLALLEAGYKNIVLNTVLFPAWTTEWMSEAGKEKLKSYGIAPPVNNAPATVTAFAEEPEVVCPQCGSHDTTLVSRFGSTACKALYQCNTCKEPFDYFKCH